MLVLEFLSQLEIFAYLSCIKGFSLQNESGSKLVRVYISLYTIYAMLWYICRFGRRLGLYILSHVQTDRNIFTTREQLTQYSARSNWPLIKYLWSATATTTHATFSQLFFIKLFHHLLSIVGRSTFSIFWKSCKKTTRLE